MNFLFWVSLSDETRPFMRRPKEEIPPEEDEIKSELQPPKRWRYKRSGILKANIKEGAWEGETYIVKGKLTPLGYLYLSFNLIIFLGVAGAWMVWIPWKWLGITLASITALLGITYSVFPMFIEWAWIKCPKCRGMLDVVSWGKSGRAYCSKCSASYRLGNFKMVAME